MLDLGLSDTDRVATSLGGGLPEGGLVLIEGGKGGGKSVWAQRFAYGICYEGNQVTYISAEENSKSFLKQMKSLSYDVTGMLLRQQMLFLNADIDTQSHISESMTDDQGLVENLLDSDVPWRSDLVIIDNFGELLRNDERFDRLIAEGEADHAMQNVRSVLDSMMNEGKTIIICVDPSTVTDQAIRPIRGMSTAYLQLDSKTVGGEKRRSMEVKQFKGITGNVEDSIGFAVQGGSGIVIQSRNIA